MKRTKTKSNLICVLSGLIDRLFRRIHINENREAISGFIAERMEAYNKNASFEIDAAQKEVNSCRTFADEQISQLSEEDVKLLYQEQHKTTAERRRGKKVAENIDSLFRVNNSIKATHVKLHGELDGNRAELKRELTAYLLAGIGRKQRSSIDIEASTNASYELLVAYSTYLENYRYVDTYIKEFVDKIVNYRDKISRIIKEDEDKDENS